MWLAMNYIFQAVIYIVLNFVFDVFIFLAYYISLFWSDQESIFKSSQEPRRKV